MQGGFAGCARNDSMGKMDISDIRTQDRSGECFLRNVIPSEVEGSFLHIGIVLYVGQQKRGNPAVKCLQIVILVPSSRA